MHKIASNKGFKKALMAIALVALMVVGPLGAIQQGSASAPLDRGTRGELILRVAMQDDLKTLNPLSAGDVWTWNVIGWVFDGLIWRNNSNNDHIEPWAAEWFHHGPENTWDTSVGYPDNDANPDYRNWTLKLRNNIKWHDWNTQTGDDQYVRAHDVIFSVRLVANVARYAGSVECVVARNDDGSLMMGSQLPANGTIQLITYDGQTVKKLPYWIDLSDQKQYPDLPVVYITKETDDLTLHYFLTHDYADFTTDTLGALIFPERIWKNHIDPASHSGDLTWDDPQAIISFGPFKFTSWDRDSRVSRIDTFRDYFHVEYDDKGRAKPYIDAIVFQIFQNTDAAVMALTSDKVDYIAWAIDPGFIDTIIKSPNLALVRNSDLGFFYVAFNMRKPEFGYAGYNSDDVSGGTPTYTGDYTDVGKPFRVAMAHLINKQYVVNKFLQGFGSVGTSVVSPVNSYWYNPNIRIYNYDPNEANRILDQYAPDADGDGIREMPYIGENEITMLTPPADYDPIRAQTGLMIQAEAKKAGLNFKSQPTAFGEIVNQIGTHSFQMYMLGWSIPSPMSSATAPCDFFGSRFDGGGNNYPGYHNASFDKLCDQMNRELDMEKRRQIDYKLQEIVAEDVPYSVLYYRDVLEAYNTKFTGWVPRYGSIFNWYSLKELRVQPPSNWELSLSVPTTINGGETTNLAAYLYDKYTNEAIPDVTVTFNVDNGTVSSQTVTTDSTGKAEVTYTAPTPSGNLSMSVEISVSVYDPTAEITIKKTAYVVVLPTPPPTYELEIKFTNLPPNTNILTTGNNEPISLEIQVLNKNTLEPYGELDVNKTGVELQYIISPSSGARFDYQGYSNGKWTYLFTGTAAPDTTQTYVIKITAILKEKNLTVSATSKDMTFSVIGPKTQPTTGTTGPATTPSVGIIPILASVGIAAVVYNHYRRKKKS